MELLSISKVLLVTYMYLSRMEGRGKFTFVNGNQYVGYFKDGMFHGAGTIYFTPENGGGRFIATWKDGVAQEVV